MKTTLLIPLLFGALAVSSFHAIAQSITESAHSGESRQGEIQVSSQALVDELDAMIDEYQRNALNGDDIKNLKSLRVVLGKMSEKDMARILGLLQQAGAQKDPATALRVIAAAYSQQKGVLLEMKQILAGYASQDEALELSKSVTDLADRQAANLQTGIDSAQWAADHEDQTPIAASLEAQAAEQKAIGDEMKVLESKIADFAKDPNNKDMAQRLADGLQAAAKIDPVVGVATDALNQKKPFEAVVSEKSARDQLRQLARAIAPPEDEADALQAAADQLDKIISQQKDMITATSDAIPLSIQDFASQQIFHANSDLFRWAQKNGLLKQSLDQLATQQEVQNAYKGYCGAVISGGPALESQEGDLANQSDALSQDLEKIAKPAADALTAAIPPMQSARSSLSDRDTTDAAKSEKDALAALEKARDALEQQLAAAEKAEEQSGDPIADLQQVQKDTQALMQQQAALDTATAAPKTSQQAAADAQQQGALQQQAQQLQQQAAADAPAASQSLSNAAANMQQAAGAMPNPAQGAQAQAQQAQAMQNLAQANNQLSQQIAQLQQVQQQLAQAQKALDEVEKLIEAEQKLRSDTVQAAAQQAKQRPVIQALAPRQQDTRNETNDFAKTVTAAEQQTAVSASGHMGDAHDHLATGDGTAADPDEGKALDDLYALKNSLEAQIQADENQLAAGSQADSQADQSAANAAAAIAQAQADLGQAMSAISSSGAQAADQQAAGQMSQDASAVGNAAAQGTGLPAAAQDAMRAASGALATAAGQAAAGQNSPAQGSGQQAQQALGQAAAALAQMAAGIASAGSPGQPGAPGPGNMPGAPSARGTGNNHPIQLTAAAQSVGGRLPGGRSQYVRLPARDRATIEQSQSEKYPPQYAAKVEQYLENLSNDSGEQ